ncbi:hypothetical protein [Sinorhizobium sp. NFACC03]|uniref:hypothetical protein n=1 Tax=Sinorhizobium sp. NFACC03 TaxID=1566295 RepID=UPI001AECF40D|nr:hypothetical protein [Sinorhizobium sp. NFACC03]
MDHDAILDVRAPPDADRFHLTSLVDLVGADDGIGADEHIVLNDPNPQMIAVGSTKALSDTLGQSPHGLRRIMHFPPQFCCAVIFQDFANPPWSEIPDFCGTTEKYPRLCELTNMPL